MSADRLRDILETILRARDHEIVCSEFFEHLPRYVELVMTRADSSRSSVESPETVWPAVAHHIAQCSECAEEYELLLEMLRVAP